MIDDQYLGQLRAHLAAVLPDVHFCWMSDALRNPLTDDMDLWATPGWEGLPGLPWSVESDGDVPAHGVEPVEWTGEPEQDVILYRAAVARLVARLRASLARGAYHRIHWTDACVLDVGVGFTADEPDALIPGVVHQGNYVLVHSMFLDEPHEWPIHALILED
mgnify:CR=1 FL=1